MPNAPIVPILRVQGGMLSGSAREIAIDFRGFIATGRGRDTTLGTKRGLLPVRLLAWPGVALGMMMRSYDALIDGEGYAILAVTGPSVGARELDGKVAGGRIVPNAKCATFRPTYT